MESGGSVSIVCYSLSTFDRRGDSVKTEHELIPEEVPLEVRPVTIENRKVENSDFFPTSRLPNLSLYQYI